MITITLPSETESALLDEARRLGTTAESLAVEILRERLVHPPSPTNDVPSAADEKELSAADFFAGYFGNVDSSEETGQKSYSSVDTGKKFTEIVVEKHRRGKL